MEITQTEQGYSADDGIAPREFSTLDELFQYLLCHFEGRCRSFAGEESYGCIRIFRHPPEIVPGRR